MTYEIQKLTDIDLTELQIGERLTIYRGSSAFLTGPGAAGYVGEATVIEIKRKSALLSVPKAGSEYIYRLRFKDMRICRVPNGETTMLYVHARSGRPTVTAYFTSDEYKLIKRLLLEAAEDGLFTTRKRANAALDRMRFHDNLR